MAEKRWEAVAAEIERRGAKLAQDEPLPRERELACELGVSRATVRRALAALREKGVVESVRGRGTFYRPHAEKGPWSLPAFSTTEMAEVPGAPVVARVLRLRRVTAPRVICDWLELEHGAEAWEIQRLRSRGDQPVSLELAYVPLSVCGALDAEELAGSLYRVLAEKAGREAVSSHQRVSPATLDEREAGLLGALPGSPALRVLNTTYDKDGRPFEASLALLPGATSWLDIHLGPDGEHVRRRV